MTDANTMLFREDQRFRAWWLLAIVGFSSAIAIGGGILLIVGQVILGHPLGTRPMPDGLALAAGIAQTLIGLSLIWLFFAMVLQVEVTPRGLFVRFFPFHWKVRQIDLSDVTAIQAVTYRPIRDYGGWGLRMGLHSRCYNVRGNEGVRIDYNRNFHLLIGSQHAKALEAALHTIWQAPENDEETP